MTSTTRSDRQVRTGVRYGAVLLVVLVTAWLLWSGHLSALLVAIGLGSCGLIVLPISIRMGIVDEEGQPIAFGLRPLFYLPWLAWAIVRANLDVTRRILSPGLRISPRLVSVPAPQKTDLAKVIYANSITLTPGTVSVELEDETILVHAISIEAAGELEEGEMSRRVLRVEGIV